MKIIEVETHTWGEDCWISNVSG